VAETIYPFLSSLEKLVWDWLTAHKIPFEAQQKMFGTMEIGSAVVDFILTERQVAIRCMGGYWHSGLTPVGRDRLGKEKLIEAGYIVVDCWEDDLTRRLDYTLDRAIKGEELPR